MTTPRADRGTSSCVAEPSRELGRILRLVLLAVLAAIVVACSAEPEPTDSTTAEGVIVAVQGGLTDVEAFDLVLTDGSRLTFVPEAGSLERSGFSPAHLREHAALAAPISVRYHVVEGRNMVIGIVDADG